METLDASMLVRLLDVEAERRKILTNNLANLDTPGYRTARLSFKRALSRTLAEAEEHDAIETEISHPAFEASDPSGNNVGLGREVTELNKNALRTETYLEYLKFRKRMTRAAIQGK
jgi:flagellar basal-body rod protein FlgB